LLYYSTMVSCGAPCVTLHLGLQAIAAPNSPTDRFAQLGCSIVSPFCSKCVHLARDDFRKHMSA
jgi:hypothetical protein